MIDWEIEKDGSGGDVLVFKLTGRLETVECDYLLSVLGSRIGDGDNKIILDCHQLEYISSLGLSMLIRVHAKMKKAGGDVKLARVHGAVATVIATVYLDRVFHLYPTVQAAVESFQA